MGGAQQQAAIWGGAPDDWTTLQEPNHIPLWNAMLDALEVGAGSRVLDAACGGGGSSVLIAERGAEVEGIDVTPALIELARQRVPAGTFVVGDIEALPQADGTFDAVLAANAVQFSVDREATVRGFARVCREGGRVAIGNFGPPDDVAFTEVLGAVRSVLPGADTTRQPLDLSAPGRQEALIDAADLRLLEVGTVDCPFTYADVETSLRAIISAGPFGAAAEQVGADRIRDVLRPIMERYERADGRVVIGPNIFRFVVAEV